MKDVRPLIYILLIPFGIVSVLFVITLVALATSNQEPVKELFSMTGTIGDTLGGITTCLVSGLTLFYIITTFKDQSSINQHTKSTNNFSIFYDLLKKMEIKIDSLKFSNGINSKKGLDSITFFENWILETPMQRLGSYGDTLSSFDFFNRFTENEFEFFSNTIDILKDLEKFKTNLNSVYLDKEHKDILLEELNSISKQFLKKEKELMSHFYRVKTLLLGDETFSHNINDWFNNILEYQNIMAKLIEIEGSKAIIESEDNTSKLKFDFNAPSSSTPFKIDKSIFDKI